MYLHQSLVVKPLSSSRITLSSLSFITRKVSVVIVDLFFITIFIHLVYPITLLNHILYTKTTEPSFPTNNWNSPSYPLSDETQVKTFLHADIIGAHREGNKVPHYQQLFMNNTPNTHYREPTVSIQDDEDWLSSNNPSPSLSELSQSLDYEVVTEPSHFIFPTQVDTQISSSITSDISRFSRSNPSTLPTATSMASAQYSVPPHQNIPSYPLPMMNLQPTNLYINPLFNMPAKNAKYAPKKFTGKYTEVKRFVQHYSQLLIQYQIIEEADKCIGILEYVSRSVKDFIKSLPDFIHPNWERLQANILKFYDVEREENRFQHKDLLEYVQITATKMLHNLAQWKEYYREYNSLAGYLHASNRISDREYDGYFWYGIPKDLRNKFKDKLEVRLPLHNKDMPWPMSEIDLVADQYFQRDTFYDRLPHLASFGIKPEQDHYEESDEDSDTESDSDSDSHYYRQRVSRRKKKLTKKRGDDRYRPEAVISVPKIEDDRRHKINAPPEELSNLIQELNTMSLLDNRYGKLYYDVLSKDTTGLAAKCIRRPPLQEDNTIPIQNKPIVNTNPFIPPNAPIPSYASYPNNIPIGNRPTNAPPAGSINYNRCFGCFDPQHMLNECPKINDYLKQGIIKRDPDSRKFTLSMENDFTDEMRNALLTLLNE